MVLFTLATVLIDAAISNADKPFIKSDSRIMSAQPSTEQGIYIFSNFKFKCSVFQTQANLNIRGMSFEHYIYLEETENTK